MPFAIKLPQVTLGYTSKASRKGEQASVITRGFLSSDDGSTLITFLEGLPSEILRLLPKTVNANPSTVDLLVATIAADGATRVFLNEFDIKIKARSKKPLSKGQPMTSDDIADIESIELVGIDPAADEGFLFVFSVGWRKALFFDLSPLGPHGRPRNYDLAGTLGSCYAYAIKPHLFRLTDQEWKTLLGQGWFPFIGLRDSLAEKLIGYVGGGYQGDDLVDEIEAEVTGRLSCFLQRWKSHSCIMTRMPLVERALGRYKERDYISASAILYPQIEGVMREYYNVLAPSSSPKQSDLVKVTVGQEDNPERSSFLLPHRFRQYLEEVYFASFKSGEYAPVSRHSVAHGVADPAKFNAKAATVAILTLDQIFFFLPRAAT